MEATRLQMQNFLIFLLDLVGVTVGYFAAVWLRFGNIETGYTVMGNDTYYRWLIAIVVLMMIYFLFRPNRGFFKRKFIEEMRMNLQTVVLMAAGMAMVAFLIQDAEDYSRFIYIFTSGFGFVWMQITHRAYRKYWLSRRKDHSYARKMMIITTSDYAEEVIGNIMEEKNWDLWITSVAVVDKDMTGWLINEIPVVAHSYRSIFEYAMRSVVDEVFLYIPMDDEFPIAVTVQNFEDMGIKTNLNISQFQINENLERSLEKVGPYESVSFSGHNVVPSRRGGIERVLTIMCPLMIKKGHQVTCFNRSGDKVENEYVKTVKRKKYRGVQLKKVITINKRGLAAMTSSFSAAICAAFGKYDIVHFHAEGPSAFLWIPKLFGKRCIVTIHGIDWARDKWKHGFGSRYIKFGEYIAAKYADEVIVLSEKVQKYFKKFYDRDTVLIPNGVMTHENRKANLITQKFGLHKDEYICALSRLTEEKGIHFLIEAYKELKTDKKLVIAGAASDTDGYVKMLKEMAGNDPNIIFTGFVSGKLLEEIYSNAYVYVLPSKLEGMPLSLLEAMSYGNCVIGSDIAEIADVVEDKAILFKKANVEDLKEKLQMVCDDVELVEKYKSEASGYICGRYNWEDVVNRTVEVYRGKKSCKEKLVENSSVASI